MHNNKKHLRNDLGFTLVEMLLYIGLFTIFLGALTWIFHAVLEVQLSAYSSSAVDIDGNYVFSRLGYDVSRANTVVQPEAVGENSTSLILNIQGNQHTYQLTGDTLVLTNANGASNLNSHNTSISQFNVQRMGNIGGKNAVVISFTMSGGNPENANIETRTFRIVEGLR